MLGLQFENIILNNREIIWKAIDKSIIEEVQQKLDRISIPRNFTLRPILIHINGVQSAVEDEEYFDEIINFGAYFEGNM